MDFVNKVTGGSNKEGGSSQNDMLNKGTLLFFCCQCYAAWS